jgi:hypothetical protein
MRGSEMPCWLKAVAFDPSNADTSWTKQPKVLLQIRHVDRFIERAEKEWPPARTDWTKLYLDPADGTLGEARPGKRTT